MQPVYENKAVFYIGVRVEKLCVYSRRLGKSEILNCEIFFAKKFYSLLQKIHSFL